MPIRRTRSWLPPITTSSVSPSTTRSTTAMPGSTAGPFGEQAASTDRITITGAIRIAPVVVNGYDSRART
jgi:hypothetical protein